MNKFALIVVAVVIAPSPSSADDAYVTFAKSLAARQYDNNLPSVPVERWLNSHLPHGIKAVWGGSVTDCGEFTGDAKTDKGRSMPLCVEVELERNGDLVGYLLLLVGTEEEGRSKESAALYYGYMTRGIRTIELRKLGEIANRR